MWAGLSGNEGYSCGGTMPRLSITSSQSGGKSEIEQFRVCNDLAYAILMVSAQSIKDVY